MAIRMNLWAILSADDDGIRGAGCTKAEVSPRRRPGPNFRNLGTGLHRNDTIAIFQKISGSRQSFSKLRMKRLHLNV